MPPDPEAIGVSRRQFLNRATVSLMGAGLTTFAAAGFVAFLWPHGAGRLRRQGQRRQARRHPRQHPQQRRLLLQRRRRASWITAVPADALPKAEAVHSTSRCSTACRAGIVALYQKCPHLGCRVPECASSQWFECPCHGSQYNRVGEKKAGPAPRGMDRFPRHASPARRRRHRHRHSRSPARRSAPTPPAKRPKARTASAAAAEVTDDRTCRPQRSHG